MLLTVTRIKYGSVKSIFGTHINSFLYSNFSYLTVDDILLPLKNLQAPLKVSLCDHTSTTIDRKKYKFKMYASVTRIQLFKTCFE